MQRFTIDAYVVDVLMPDLVGHDRRPATFVVYLFLLRQAAKARRDSVSISLQSIATKTGLSKSTVQTALRHLRRRRLLDPAVSASVTVPLRHILRPWVRDTALKSVQSGSKSAIPPERHHDGNALRREIGRPDRDIGG
jgi:DNA-binding transcriptional MocR family regulator